MIGRSSGRWPLTLLAAAVTVSCDTGSRASEDSLSEREQRGDTVFVHSRGPIHSDTAGLVEVVRIGMAEGPEELLLDDVSAFVELPDGRLVAADRSGLRAFSPGGESAEWIARPGEGPGEVGSVVGMDVASDGSLLAVDLGNRRINVYRLTTGDLDRWSLPPGMSGYGRTSVVSTRGGAVYVAYNPALPRDGPPMRYPRPIFLRLDDGGETLDTVFADERFAAACPTLSTSTWRSGFYEDLRALYFPKVKWALGPTGVVAVGCPADYRLDLLRPDGTVLRISRDWEPIRVEAAERRSFVDGQTFSRNRSGYFESWSWEGDPPPERKPAYQRILFGREGRIWIWPAQPSVPREVPAQFRQPGLPSVVYDVAATGAFDVFTADGDYLGAVRLPDDVPYTPFPGSADPFIRGDTLWAVRYDSLDVPYLVKYAVRWGEGR